MYDHHFVHALKALEYVPSHVHCVIEEQTRFRRVVSTVSELWMTCVEERLDGSEFVEPKNTDDLLHCIQCHAVDQAADTFVFVEHVEEIHFTLGSLVSFFVFRGNNLDGNFSSRLNFADISYYHVHVLKNEI